MADSSGVAGGRGTSRTTALLAVGQLVSWGALYYAFAVLLPTVRDDVGWSTTLLTAAFSLGVLTSGLLAPAVGRVIDRAGSRTVMAAGSLVGAAGLALWALAKHPAAMLTAWLLIGVAMATTLYEPAFATIVRERPSHRRSAIVTVSLVGALASPIFTPLTGWATQRFGWRITLLLLAAAVATTALMYRRLPDSRTVSAPPSAEDTRDAVHRVPRPSADLRSLTLGIVAASGVATAANAHAIAVLLDTGRTPAAATLLVASIGLARLAGRALILILPPTVAPRRTVAVALTIQAVGLITAVAPGHLVWALPVLFGSGSGAMTVIKPLAVVELTPTDRFAFQSGRIHRTSTLAKAATPLLLGVGTVVFDGYATIWMTLPATLLIVAAIVILQPRNSTTDTGQPGEFT